MVYLLDSNVLIEAKNHYYRFEFCSAFWDWIERAHANGSVYTIRQVKDELLAINDELTRWIKRLPSSFFLEPDPALIASRLLVVSAWVDHAEYDEQLVEDVILSALEGWPRLCPEYEQHAKDEFLRSTDYYLVAIAAANGCALVTHEVPAPRRRERITIRDACAALGVECLTMFDMLQEEGAQFGLEG